jgi:hypothetical protein
VDLLANINIYRAIQIPSVLHQLNDLLADPKRFELLVQVLKNRGQYDKEVADMVPVLLSMNQSPDFIQDHGHTFGANLPDDQKRALIEYMKTF